MSHVRPRACDRAREWISLELDAELSELEDALLRRHLARCACCGAFRTEARAFTQVLRSTPLEPAPATVALPRRRPRVRALQLAAATLVAATVGVGALVGSMATRESGAPKVKVTPAAFQDDRVEVTIARRAALLAQTPHFWLPRRGFRIALSSS